MSTGRDYRIFEFTKSDYDGSVSSKRYAQSGYFTTKYINSLSSDNSVTKFVKVNKDTTDKELNSFIVSLLSPVNKKVYRVIFQFNRDDKQLDMEDVKFLMNHAMSLVKEDIGLKILVKFLLITN